MTLHPILPIPWWRLLAVGLALVLLLALSRALHLKVGQKALVASARGTVQLVLVGYYLGALLSVRRFELAGVRDGKTEDACVKIPHSLEILDEHPHVAESKFRNGHV